ncbi:sulfate permease [Pseudomonas putida S11]|nr:sulfate permease [Pseudomonas putida S11]
MEGLQLATMMAGAILLVLGITRLGAVIKFIPDPVIVGFTAGIGIIIWVGQWRDFFGLPEIEGGHFHEKTVASVASPAGPPHCHDAARDMQPCFADPGAKAARAETPARATGSHRCSRRSSNPCSILTVWLPSAPPSGLSHKVCRH